MEPIPSQIRYMYVAVIVPMLFVCACACVRACVCDMLAVLIGVHVGDNITNLDVLYTRPTHEINKTSVPDLNIIIIRKIRTRGVLTAFGKAWERLKAEG